jgi:NAD(P)-dependent dehydrogenase (short-subunit alcohol dehydrogenase family)
MSTLSALYGGFHTLYSNLFVTLPTPKPKTDMSQHIYIVTGSNTGLGLELSRHLLRAGIAKLIVAVRNPDKGATAAADLLTSTGRPKDIVEVWPLDMDSPSSIAAFAHRATSTLPRLDGVCANAGLLTTTFTLTASHEKTLTVNVIHTFLLFFHLLPLMRKHHTQTGTPTTFTIPNSALHYTAHTKELLPLPQSHSTKGAAQQDPTPIFTRLDDPAKADMQNRYPLSKLLVLWLVRELTTQATTTTTTTKSSTFPLLNTPNPSFCQSSLLREDDSALARYASKLVARTTEEGSRALWHALVEEKAGGGVYTSNCRLQV